MAANLLALVVKVVDLLAGERRLASLGTVVVAATALTPLVNSTTGGRVGGRVRLSRRVGGGGAGAALVGAADGTELDVGEGNLGVGDVLLEVGRHARGCRARSSLRADLGRVSGVGRVEPEHVRVVLCTKVNILCYMVNPESGITYVVPERHNKNHGSLESVAHAAPATLLREVIDVAKDLLLVGAEVSGKRVSGSACNLGLRVGNDVAVLDVETSDLRELAVATSVELGDDSNLLGGVDVEVRSGTVEGLVTLTVRVEVTSVGIASSAIAVVGVGSTTRVASARVLSELGARVRSVGS